MRLLDTETLRLEFFLGSGVPPYAILSHTWGEGEILYEDVCDLNKPLPTHKTGFAKVEGSCEQARRDGYHYIWIDTCCIDKSSSAELSEAINSMFQWYHESARCYAYLADFNAPGVARGRVPTFDRSRWFTRGWTLQELIAPRDVRFFDHNWTCIGTRQNPPSGDCNEDCLIQQISQRTDIPQKVLGWNKLPPRDSRYNLDDPYDKRIRAWFLKSALRSCSTAQKLSWVADRTTTREEDMAYSLLGLFGVNMPLLYGEGRRAFFRLQQEIMRVSDDQSILAYAQRSNWGLLADSPRRFLDSEIECTGTSGWGPEWPGGPQPPYELSPSAKYLNIGLCLCPLRRSRSGLRVRAQVEAYLGILDCVYRSDRLSHPAMVLRPADQDAQKFYRSGRYALKRVEPSYNDGLFRVRGSHQSLYGNLTEAYYSAVRVYFDEDPEGDTIFPPSPEPPTHCFGIKINIGQVAKVSDIRVASYPTDPRLGSNGSIYVPAAAPVVTPSIDESGFAVTLVGTVVVHVPLIGIVVLGCGVTEELPEEPLWAMLHLSELSDIVNPEADPDDLAAIARLVYESRAFLTLALRRGDRNILGSPVLRGSALRGVVRRGLFFGRPLAEIDLKPLTISTDTIDI